jgi:hypothetical protein
MEKYPSYLKKRNLTHIIVPLVIGFILYLFFHKPNLLLNFYLQKCIAIPNYYDHIKENKILVFLLNHLPDALWIYALGVFLFVSLNFVNNNWLKAALILILGSLTEIVQLFLPQQFTFDWIDLLINIIILTLIFYKYENEKNI